MTEATQPVAQDAPAVAQPTASAPDARNDGYDLDGLLNEFVTETKPATQPQPEPKQPAQTAVVDEEARRQIAEWQFERDIQPVLKTVRGDIPQEVFSDKELQWWLDGRAKEDARLQQAWLNRKSNPQAWGKLEKALSGEFSKKFQKLPDPNATEDRDAVYAAVRGASHKAPPDTQPNLGQMSNAELRKHTKEKYGFDPGV